MISSVRTHIQASTKLFMGLFDWIIVKLKHYYPMYFSAIDVERFSTSGLYIENLQYSVLIYLAKLQAALFWWKMALY